MSKILLIAPQPFYTERGTPIAVLNLINALSESGYEVDLLTFPYGADVSVPNVTIHRVGNWLPLPKKLPVGFSVRKLLLDCVMFFKAASLCRRNPYPLIHGVEEAAFISLAARKFSPVSQKPKVVYDMDSSMSDQLVERWPSLKILHRIFDRFEGLAVRNSDHILAVCSALKNKCEQYANHAPITVIEDISDNRSPHITTISTSSKPDDLSQVLPDMKRKMLYVGNLEHYQGVGLVLDAMAETAMPDDIGFIVIGGQADDIQKYQRQADNLGITQRIRFLGARPVSHLAQYLKQADLLVSPRLKGVNTPMKIYTYLGAGKIIVATKIYSHTQILNANNACLVEPTASKMAQGIRDLFLVPGHSEELAKQAFDDATERYSYARYKQRIAEFYRLVLI